MIIAVMALLVAVGGAAFADIPGVDGVIHGCYDAEGRLRVIDSGASCGADTALDWNLRGGTGPVGQPGPPGAPGESAPPPSEPLATPPGFRAPTGQPPKKLRKKLAKGVGEPTEAFSVFRDGEFVLAPADEDFMTVARLAVPAGRYFVVAKASLAQHDGYQFSSAQCRLQAGNAFDMLGLLTAPPLHSKLLVSFKKPGLVELRCYADQYSSPFQTDGTAHISWVKITALALAHIKYPAIKLPAIKLVTAARRPRR